jgi:parvulin-like peptidyl-prolyl isomerase
LKIVALAILVGMALVGMAASSDSQNKPSTPAAPAAPPAAAPSAEPEHIQVQHILVAFTGSAASKKPRTQEDAKKLAYELLDKAKKGADFDALVKEYSEDMYPCIYSLANNGVTPAQGEYPRNRMVAAFGDTGFPLKVGEVGIADYDTKKSPYGWHVVKRLK